MAVDMLCSQALDLQERRISVPEMHLQLEGLRVQVGLAQSVDVLQVEWLMPSGAEASR